MRTWEDYKEHVRNIDSFASKELDEAVNQAAIISAMIKQRNELGLSQRDLAAMCGIPQSSVARIESYKTTPNLDTLLKIFRQLGLQLSVSPVESYLPK